MKGTLLALGLCLLVTSSGCGEGVGACQEVTGERFNCKDDWTEEECEDWNAQDINGSSWAFHEGQSCSDR